MQIFNGRKMDGFKANEQEPIASVEAEGPLDAGELIRGFKLSASDFLAAPCVEVWPVNDPYSKQRFYRIR